jgi:formamidopyrimidine-DNA glycosylase
VPKLAEVEAVRRVLDQCLAGKRIAEVEAAHDSIVFEGRTPEAIRAALLGRQVVGTGRKGKTFWLNLDEGCLLGHLGMTGWVRDLSAEREKRLISHGEAPLDDAEGHPRFLRLRLRADDGKEAVLTDGRRLARVWIGTSAEEDPRVKALGPDALTDPQGPAFLEAKLGRRKAPIKSLLMDQKILSGLGNWLADEILYQAGVSPHRLAMSLSSSEFVQIDQAMGAILRLAVEAEADETAYPPDWLFHHRWGGRHGADTLGGSQIRRDVIGGRTAAWVPDKQK